MQDNSRVQEVTKVFLSNTEAQAYLGVGTDFFKALRAEGKLPYYKVGKTVFYRKSAIDKLVEDGRVC
jgi:excisionase family DNA binding protein